MGSAGGATTLRSGRHALSETLGGPQPTWRYKGPRERSDPPRNADTLPRGFIHIRRHVDSGNQVDNICMKNNVFTLDRYPVRIQQKREAKPE